MLPVNQRSQAEKFIRQRANADNRQNSTQIKKCSTTKFMLICLLNLGILLVAMQLYAADNVNKDNADNWYAKSYKAQNRGNLVSLQANPDTKMYVSNRKDDDDISMLESGYDLMGSSGFTAGDVPSEQALAYAKTIKADTVLVYSKYGSSKTADSKIQLIKEAAKSGKDLTEKDLATEPIEYKYYASYWAKLPAPLLGVHVIKLTTRSQEDEKPVEEKGLKVIAVIKDSAAAKANLKRGDVLIKIGDTVLDKPEQLSASAQQYKGKTVPVVYERGGEESTVQVAINQR